MIEIAWIDDLTLTKTRYLRLQARGLKKPLEVKDLPHEFVNFWNGECPSATIFESQGNQTRVGICGFWKPTILALLAGQGFLLRWMTRRRRGERSSQRGWRWRDLLHWRRHWWHNLDGLVDDGRRSWAGVKVIKLYFLCLSHPREISSCLVKGKYWQPCLKYVGKTGTYKYKGRTFRCSTPVGSHFTRALMTKRIGL